MNATACTSFASHRRIARARAWLMARAPAEELLIIGATLDATNELARAVAQTTGGAFGWHRFTLAQLAATLAAPTMAARGIVPAGRLGVEAIVCRAVHALSPGGALGRYACIAKAPGFARAIASVLTEIRLAAVGPEVLGKVAPDLLLLLRAYEAELAEGKFTDWPGMLTIAAETAADCSTTTRRLMQLPICCSTCQLPAKQNSIFSPHSAHPRPRSWPPCRSRTSRLSPVFGTGFDLRSKIWMKGSPLQGTVETTARWRVCSVTCLTRKPPWPYHRATIRCSSSRRRAKAGNA